MHGYFNILFVYLNRLGFRIYSIPGLQAIPFQYTPSAVGTPHATKPWFQCTQSVQALHIPPNTGLQTFLLVQSA